MTRDSPATAFTATFHFPLPMKYTSHSVIVCTLFLGLGISGCDKKPDVIIIKEGSSMTPQPGTRTLETSALSRSITVYEQEPNAFNAASVKKAVAELDGEIAELEERIAKTSGSDRAEAAQKLADLSNYRSQQIVRFSKAQATGTRTVHSTGPVLVPRDDAKDAADRVGNSIEKGARNVGDAIRDAVR